MKRLIIAAQIILLAGIHTVSAQTFSPFGKWRGVFQFREGIEVPFNFEITGKTIADAKVFFINAAERFDGGSIKRRNDSLYIALEQFDNEFALKITDGRLEGVLHKTDGSGSPLKITAEKGKAYRFKAAAQQPAGDISGTYDIVFGNADSTVGLFTQEGKKLSATFLSITGDSRYLEGIVDGNKFYLSSFIGAGPSYYRGTFNKDGTVSGEQIGVRSSRLFSGRQNDDAKLPDLYSLTYLKKGYNRFDFSFPDVNGNKVSLTDQRFKNKPVIIAITGTWCPNCMDETVFLSEWYKKNKSRGVEIVAIHYERKDDPLFVQNALGKYRKKFDVGYTQVFGGLSDKQYVASSLPSLNTFLSFPTTIFINKKGEVAKIHTGYTGPATGKFYAAFVREFNAEVDHLLAE